MQQNNCIFCNIVKKELSSNIVFENKHTLAFLDINPVNEGHTLIIPKKHYKNFTECPDNLLLECNKTVQLIAPAILKALNTDGYNLNINNGSTAGQVIFHLHYHLVPRFKNDNLKLWPGKKFTEEEMSTTTEKIKKYLPKKFY